MLNSSTFTNSAFLEMKIFLHRGWRKIIYTNVFLNVVASVNLRSAEHRSKLTVGIFQVNQELEIPPTRVLQLVLNPPQ